MLTRNRKVKIKADTIREDMTAYDLFRLVICPSITELPRTIGKIGKTQGVRTVRNPAISEIIKKIIIVC